MADVKDSRAEELCSMGNSLFTEKSGYDQLCQEIAENFYPERADFTMETSISVDFGVNLMDSSPVLARETLGNYIEAMLRQGEWFKLGTGDEERDKKAANALGLDRGTKALRTILRDPRTNFSAEAKLLDMDYVAFGQNVYSWEERENKDGLVLKSHHPKLCAWMRGDDDQVYAMFRRLTMTARNYKKKIDSGAWKGTLPQAVQNCCDTEPFKKFNLMHILCPADMIYGSDGKKMREYNSRGHEFCSVYVDTDNRAYLHDSGAKVFNYGTSRWRKLSRINYGVSPASLISIPDGRMLQQLKLIILESGEKRLDPPMLGAGDVLTREMNIFAGGLTMLDLPEDARIQDKLMVLDQKGDHNIGADLLQDTRGLIAEAWLLNKLTLPNVREMTAYESGVRVDEFRRAALPFFSPIDSSYHGPMLDIELQMAINLGYVRPEMFPEELHSRDAKFTFDSPLNQAEGRKQVTAFQESLQIIATGSQVDQTIANIFDMREAASDAVRGTGAPPKWLLEGGKKRKADDQAEKVKQLAQAAQLAQGGAAVVQDVAGAAQQAQAAGLAA